MSARTALKNTFWRIPAAGVFLMLIVICLTFLGLVVLFSVSQQYTNPTTLLQRQVIWLVIASLAGAFTMFINLNALRPLMPFIAGVSVFMLMLVMVPGIGVKVNGAQRWIDLGPMRLQASEIGKLGLLFVMAHYLAANRRFFDQFVRGYVAPCSILAVYCGLIIIEPDFGTAFLCGLVGGCMLFLAGVRLRFLIPTAVAAITLFAVAIYHDPVRLKRITSFLDVEGNRNDSAYQLWQGILAFGAGGLHGVGLGEGRQQMSFYRRRIPILFLQSSVRRGLFLPVGW